MSGVRTGTGRIRVKRRQIHGGRSQARAASYGVVATSFPLRSRSRHTATTTVRPPVCTVVFVS